MTRDTSRTRLTLDRIRKLTPPTGKQAVYVFDEDPKQLCVRITPAGAKSFVFAGKLNRVPLRVTIGDVKVWNLDDARTEARRLQGLIDQGIDPRHEKAERIAATEAKREEARRVEAPALEAWAAYIEARRPRWGARHLDAHLDMSKEGGEKRTRGRRRGESDTTQPGVLRPLLLLPLARIDADCVRVWLTDETAKRPTHAALAFRLLRAFLNWCSDRPEYREHVHADACAPRLAKETLPKSSARDDCLQKEQIRPWFAEVKKLSPIQSAYLQVVLLTGPRRNEMTALRWEDVDFKWNAMTVRDKDESKGGLDGTRTIPLTPYVKSLLLGLKASNEVPPPKFRILNGKRIENDLSKWKPSPFVFSSRSESGHIEEPRIAHDKAVSAAGIPRLTIQGLRRSFSTLAEWTEAPEGVVAQIQGHKPSATREKHYKKRPLDLLRMWHTKIEAWVLEQADIEQPGEGQASGLRVVSA